MFLAPVQDTVLQRLLPTLRFCRIKPVITGLLGNPLAGLSVQALYTGFLYGSLPTHSRRFPGPLASQAFVFAGRYSLAR